MNRQIALNLAKQMFSAYRKADTDFIFGRGEEPVKADHCYRHG